MDEHLTAASSVKLFRRIVTILGGGWVEPTVGAPGDLFESSVAGAYPVQTEPVAPRQTHDPDNLLYTLATVRRQGQCEAYVAKWLAQVGFALVSPVRPSTAFEEGDPSCLLVREMFRDSVAAAFAKPYILRGAPGTLDSFAAPLDALVTGLEVRRQNYNGRTLKYADELFVVGRRLGVGEYAEPLPLLQIGLVPCLGRAPVLDSAEHHRISEVLRFRSSQLRANYSAACWGLGPPEQALVCETPLVMRVTGRVLFVCLLWQGSA